MTITIFKIIRNDGGVKRYYNRIHGSWDSNENTATTFYTRQYMDILIARIEATGIKTKVEEVAIEKAKTKV